MTVRPLAAALILAASLLTIPAAAHAAPADSELALHWAPVHHQDTDDSDADADYLTAVDFDGDWSTTNNWEHQDDDPADLRATVYYSVIETATHWHLLYAFYHPRDWSDVPIEWLTHENDMEGVLLTVRRTAARFGVLESMVTVAHADFLAYTPPSSPYTSGQQPIAGQVRFAVHAGLSRPVTFAEAKGHGVYGWNGNPFPGGDGIVYYPSAATAEVPSGGNDRNVTYRLVDLLGADGLWARRLSPQTFVMFGVFRGDNGVADAAHAPWAWSAGDGQPPGRLAAQPAALVSEYFDGTGEFALSYLRNAYQSS